MKKIQVWDFPTRLFHILLTVLLVGAWLSIEYKNIELHAQIGYAFLCLILFRVCWGVIGSTTARFNHFITSPKTAMHYLALSVRLKASIYSGHNPAGGWMVVFMLILLTLQVISGLYSNNDLGFAGLLADKISKPLSDLFTQLHAWNFNLILAAIWLHLIAVFFYVLVKKHNLIKAMITGYKPEDIVNKNENITFANNYRSAILSILLVLCWFWLQQ